MSRESKLLKNTGIIAIGQLSSKLLSFLLLPLYTNLLLPDDFGVVDVLQTVVSLVVYFATLQMESAVFRYIIEKRNDEKNKAVVISSGIIVIIAGNIAFTFLSFIVNIFFSIPHLAPFILSFWGLSLSGVMLNIARGNGKNILYSVASFCITMSFLLINIFLIVIWKIGAVSILWAIGISNIVGALVVFLFDKDYKYVRISNFDKTTTREMLSYSLPLIPNAISWWVANASDRFIIAIFLGSTFNGIYAAANKIPTIYLTLFNVFNLAWTESVIVNIHDSDCGGYINEVFEKCFRLFSFVALGIICCSSLFFELLIGEKYLDAYYHVLILLVAIFINSLCSMYGGVFSGFKDTKAISLTTIYGAIANLLINLCLVKCIGLFAASISTLLSYLIILFSRHIYSKKHISIIWPQKYILRLCIMVLFVTTCYIINHKFLMIVSLIIIVLWGVVENKKTIKEVYILMYSKLLGRGE